jgi:hypothetical protein
MEFLSFNEYILNESLANPIKTKDAVQKYLESKGETLRTTNTTIIIDLGDDVKVVPPKYKKLIQTVIKMTNGDMLAVREITGYVSGNAIRFIFPAYRANLRKAYHVANAQDVESILANGLEPREASAHSNQFGSSLGNSDWNQTYKAAFVVGTKAGVKIVKGLFPFQDPVLLEIDPKGLDFWVDPLMREESKSALTFDKIPAERIKRVG